MSSIYCTWKKRKWTNLLNWTSIFAGGTRKDLFIGPRSVRGGQVLPPPLLGVVPIPGAICMSLHGSCNRAMQSIEPGLPASCADYYYAIEFIAQTWEKVCRQNPRVKLNKYCFQSSRVRIALAAHKIETNYRAGKSWAIVEFLAQKGCGGRGICTAHLWGVPTGSTNSSCGVRMFGVCCASELAKWLWHENLVSIQWFKILFNCKFHKSNGSKVMFRCTLWWKKCYLKKLL